MRDEHAEVALAHDDDMAEAYDGRHKQQREAELLQHELDHLDGVLAVDRADSEEAIVPREDYLSRRDEYDADVDYAITSTIG